MEITITGRHVELTKALKDYAKKRLKKIEDYFDFKDNGVLHVIITVEKYRHKAEANLNSKQHKFSAKVETKDMYSSIDEVEAKLLAQIKKLKDKYNKPEKGRSKMNVLATLTDVKSLSGEQYNEVIEEELQALKPMNTEEAMEEVEIMEDKILLFFNVDFNKVCLIRKRKDKKFGMTISKY